MYGEQKASPWIGISGVLFCATIIGLLFFYNGGGLPSGILITQPDAWTTPASYLIILAGAVVAFWVAGKLLPTDVDTGTVWRIGIAGFAAWALYIVAGPIVDRIDEALNFPASKTAQFNTDLPLDRLFEGSRSTHVNYHATLAKYGTWFGIDDEQYAMIKGVTLDQAHVLDMQTTDASHWCAAVTVQKSGNAVRILSPQPWQIVTCPSTVKRARVVVSQ